MKTKKNFYYYGSVAQVFLYKHDKKNDNISCTRKLAFEKLLCKLVSGLQRVKHFESIKSINQFTRCMLSCQMYFPL